MVRDRVGLGFRPALAAGILAHLDRIDVVEVLAEEWLDAPKSTQRAVAMLGAQVPVFLHATSLGMASVTPVDERILSRVARFVDVVRPVAWSEHLAFTRASGVEIGHLAAPPRTPATVEGTVRNLRRARSVVGALPLVENIAALLDAPCSTMDEAAWVSAILAASQAPLLFDLHNLHTNAINCGSNLASLLNEAHDLNIGMVHVAGGRLLDVDGRTRILDDHLHPVPPPVYELLSELAARSRGPLTVLIERDGAFPPMSELLAEIDAVRAALVRGRTARKGGHPFRSRGVA